MEISGRIQDKIKAHLDSQFIGPTEAYQRIFEFNMHRESPVVQRLSIHLPNKHYVNFYAYQTVNKVLARQNMKKTQLIAQFDYNSVYDNGLDLTYWQFSQHYCKKAKLQAEIKPIALCSAIDKENSIEFLLDFLYYLYNYYIVYVLLSYVYHVTHHVMSCDVML